MCIQGHTWGRLPWQLLHIPETSSLSQGLRTWGSAATPIKMEADVGQEHPKLLGGSLTSILFCLAPVTQYCIQFSAPQFQGVVDFPGKHTGALWPCFPSSETSGKTSGKASQPGTYFFICKGSSGCSQSWQRQTRGVQAESFEIS